MALRHLQLLRNATPIDKIRDAAKSAANSVKGNLKDGELIVARYLIDANGQATSANTAVAVGHMVGSGDTGYLVWNDPQEVKELVSAATASTEALEKAVGVNHNESSITSHVSSTNYISGATSVVSGLTALDTQLKATDDIAKEVRAAVGSSANTLTAEGNYVQSSQTVKEAVQALDTQLKQATDSTVKAHALLGTTSGDSRFNASGKYVSEATTVTSAATALNNAIEANDAADANLRAVVGVGSGATTLTIPEPNYVGASPQVSGAIKTLDTVEKNTRDAIGLDGSGNTISLAGTNYMSSATTVKGGLTALDTNLKELSGAVTTNKINPTDTIAVTTADTGTTLDVKLNSTVIDTTITATTESELHKNIISSTTTGLLALADLHYTPATNTLEFVNTNGKRTIQLTGAQILSSSTYDATTEEIVLNFQNSSGGTDTVKIPVGGIIEEYAFQAASGGGEAPTTGENGEHNVYLYADRTGKPGGTTPVYGEVSIFDCGTY